MKPLPKNVDRLELLKDYWEIPAAIVACFVAFYFHNYLIITLASWVAISILAILIAEIAEAISEKIPQPFDSLILTMSAVWVEILLLLMLLKTWSSIDSSDIAKNSIISAVLVDINLLFGLSLFIWWIVWKEQKHNEDSSESYTLILLVTSFILMIPTILKYTTWTASSIIYSSFWVSALLFLFYIIIMIFQTKTHVHFFKDISKKTILRKKGNSIDDIWIFETFPIGVNSVLLVLILWLVWFLAEHFAHAWMEAVSHYWVPLGIAWVIVSIISVFPELFTAVKAAKNNEIQKVVNIALWASVVTILITIPVLMWLSIYKSISFDLTLNPLQVITLIFTILLVWRSTNNWETDYLKWITHVILFISYIIMIGLS